MTALTRNGLLSAATITIIAITLFFVSFIYLAGLVSQDVIDSLREQIDISIFFLPQAPDLEVQEFKQELLTLDYIKDIEYVSAEENLARFREEHINSDVITSSLEELGENPLGAILNIKATEPSHYSAIADHIENSKYQAFVFKLNFFESQPLIDKADNLFKMIQRSGLVIGLVFILLSILISYNAIRLAIYSHRQEINIMRLVGADNRFIHWPFIIQGFLYGVIGALASFLVFALLIVSFSPKLAGFLPSQGLTGYLKGNLISFILLSLLAGIALGVISSIISIRRYLKV